MTTTINHIDDTRHHAGAMDDTAPLDPEVPERSLGRRQFSAKYKAKVYTPPSVGCREQLHPARLGTVRSYKVTPPTVNAE